MYKVFNNQEEFDYFIKDKKYNEIGFGGEGECFLGKDNIVYKIINKELQTYYNVDELITTSDYNLKCFSLPIDIYTNYNHKILYGYTNKYFKNDIFQQFQFGEQLYCNLDNLLKSYYKVIDEIEMLSNDKIYLYDIINNVLFNNNKIMVIDTIGYEKQKSNTYDKNVLLFLQSIENVFYFSYHYNPVFMNEKSIEEIIGNVKKLSNKKKY